MNETIKPEENMKFISLTGNWQLFVNINKTSDNENKNSDRNCIL